MNELSDQFKRKTITKSVDDLIAKAKEDPLLRPVMTTFSFPSELHREFKAKVSKEGLSMQEVILDLVRQYLQETTKK